MPHIHWCHLLPYLQVLCNRSSRIYTPHGQPLCNDIDDHIFYKSYRSSFPLGNPLLNQLINLVHGQQMIPHIFLIILLLLNVVEELVRVLGCPFTIIFNSPITGLYLPIRNFIFYRKRWYVPY